MATGWQAIEEEIAPWVRTQLAEKVLGRLEFLQSRPEFVALLSKDEVLHYLQTGES